MTIRAKQGAALATVFALGLAAGAALAKKAAVSPDMYLNHTEAEAATALLRAATEIAGKGSWETIAVGRVYLLAGRRQEGQDLIDRVAALPKADASDWMRIGRAWFDAGDWEKAKEAFDRVVKLKPDDADWLAEIGACYNLKGDRIRAEELFTKSFARDSADLDNALFAAGSYVGVRPQR